MNTSFVQRVGFDVLKLDNADWLGEDGTFEAEFIVHVIFNNCDGDRNTPASEDWEVWASSYRILRDGVLFTNDVQGNPITPYHYIYRQVENAVDKWVAENEAELVEFVIGQD